MKKIKKISLVVFIGLCLCSFLVSQTDDELFSSPSTIEGSDDGLFSDDDMFSDPMLSDTDAVEAPSVELTNSSLIFSAGSARFGGSLGTSLQIRTFFNDPYNKDIVNAQYIGDSLKASFLMPSIDANLFFDARPTETSRLYGKFSIGYPFETELPLAELTMGALPSITLPSFKVVELFTDFSFKDTAFFRFGKHTVKWGVGYFFSPADIINLSAIDPENPDEQREGPVSLLTHIIVPGTQTNIWAYVLPDAQSLKVIDTALALKTEFLLGTYELGIGAWYKYNRPPHAVATLTGSIAGKVGLFAEGVFAWGKEEDWLTRSIDTIKENDVALKDMKGVFKATIGANYYWKLPKLSFAGQYMWDENHQVALSVSRAEFISEKLSLSAFCLMDIVDVTGMANLNLGINCFDGLTLSTGPSFTFGSTEKLGGPQSITYSLSARLGGGRF